MKIFSTYSVQIKEYSHIFKDSVKVYSSAVDFFINVCLKEWASLNLVVSNQVQYIKLMEGLTVPTSKRPVVLYDFNVDFYKVPCYLRRAAIAEAVGKVSSYMSSLTNWKSADPRSRGAQPSVPKAGHCYPVLYRDNMFKHIDDCTAQIKVFRNNTWDWLTVQLRKSDVNYIERYCKCMKECAPVLMKRGKLWYLDFTFEEKCKLADVPVYDQIIVAVDLGINSSATCSVLNAGGTVLGRRFLKLPKEYDSLHRKISRVKYAQRHGSKSMPKLWAYAKGINDDIAVKTAHFIIDTAVMYNADCIVFEHLDTAGKKHGSKKQKLHLWKAKYVQEMVTHKAHRLGIHISHICAWGTSKLAYDGSGTVLRGDRSNRTNGCYSVCEFQNGKVYNCDLSASYNIGARYFVREILKSLPATVRQHIEAKVPGCAKRSTCTLSTLISLCGELLAAA